MHAYLFEARSIQRYLLATGKLRDIVSGSELVELLTANDGLLDNVLMALEGTGKVNFTRRGGGAFFAVGADEGVMKGLSVLWPFCVQQAAPGLDFSSGFGSGATLNEALERARILLTRSKQVYRPTLPQAGPFAARAPRTGLAAVGSRHDEFIDEATQAKHSLGNGIRLAQRFDTESTMQHWPVLMDRKKEEKGVLFPFHGEDRTVALVHADGNGLGKIWVALQEHAQQQNVNVQGLFLGFNKAVSRATEQAAQAATSDVLAGNQVDGVYPARPIVLGGDDLTMLVRGDLAFDFAGAYLKHFEEQSGNELKALKEQFPQAPLPDKLTACAGIGYAGASQPFHMMHQLAEELCAHAKRHRLGGSALCFHRITTTAVDSYEDILQNEMTNGDRRQTMEVYHVEGGYRPTVDGLNKLVAVLAKEASTLREMLGLLEEKGNAFQRRYVRWREVAGALDEFGKVMQDEFGICATEDPFTNTKKEDDPRRTPLGDVVTLMSVRGHREQTKPQPA